MCMYLATWNVNHSWGEPLLRSTGTSTKQACLSSTKMLQYTLMKVKNILQRTWRWWPYYYDYSKITNNHSLSLGVVCTCTPVFTFIYLLSSQWNWRHLYYNSSFNNVVTLWVCFHSTTFCPKPILLLLTSLLASFDSIQAQDMYLHCGHWPLSSTIVALTKYV